MARIQRRATYAVPSLAFTSGLPDVISSGTFALVRGCLFFLMLIFGLVFLALRSERPIFVFLFPLLLYAEKFVCCVRCYQVAKVAALVYYAAAVRRWTAARHLSSCNHTKLLIR